MIYRITNRLNLFSKAYSATRHEIWGSLKVLTLITLIFAITMFWAERAANPTYSFWDALIWPLVKYVEDPAEIVDAPVTVWGKIIGTLVGFLGIAIFAYHNPHKDDEYTVISELEHALAFVRHFVTNEHRRFPHIYKTETQKAIEGQSLFIP